MKAGRGKANGETAESPSHPLSRECLKKERGRKGDRRRKENVNDENGERGMMRDANGK